MLNDYGSFANGSCCRILAPRRQPTNGDNEGLLFCPRCEDAFAPVIRPGNAPKITGLFCLTCQERVGVRRGFLVTRPPMPARLRAHLSRLFAGGAA